MHGESQNHGTLRHLVFITTSGTQPAFFQLVNHPVQASSNAAQMYFAAGLSNLRASQARLSANTYFDQAVDLFENDFTFENEYIRCVSLSDNHSAA